MNRFQRESSKSLRAINQMFIPRPKSEVGRNSLRYREPLLWNYVNKMIDVSSSLSGFKTSTKSKAIVTMKSKDFNYF